ncbi:hypothetical protein LSM04_003023 [Trypanosoma melophagium]|uniref:uncharacterized protein n=1 Tax=Trypanosoma melophagium TaxID=715481 RepID=UPI00351A36AA|nr:hypothetical protein LSM04_003023 [Trypanosoma melophagium]
MYASSVDPHYYDNAIDRMIKALHRKQNPQRMHSMRNHRGKLQEEKKKQQPQQEREEKETNMIITRSGGIPSSCNPISPHTSSQVPSLDPQDIMISTRVDACVQSTGDERTIERLRRELREAQYVNM